MGRLILISDDPEIRAEFSTRRGLPDFYMEDFSILGLRVERPAEAAALLREAGYPCDDCAGATAVSFRSPVEVSNLTALLAENGIGYEMADVVDGVYQA